MAIIEAVEEISNALDRKKYAVEILSAFFFFFDTTQETTALGEWL